MNDDQGKCKLVWDTTSDDAHVSIGDINVIGVQNDLDKLVKNTVTDAVDSMFKTYFESGLRVEHVDDERHLRRLEVVADEASKHRSGAPRGAAAARLSIRRAV